MFSVCICLNPVCLFLFLWGGGDLTEISFNEWDPATERDNLHSNCKFALTHLKIAGRGCFRERGKKMADSQVHQIHKSIPVIHEWRRNIFHQQKQSSVIPIAPHLKT